MRKKPATQQDQKKSRSSKRSVSSSNILIITKKTKSTELKRAIQRHAHRQNKTRLFDHAVPSQHTFQGIVPSTWTRKEQIELATGDHAYSPFILSLKTLQEPDQVLSEERNLSPVINLLESAVHEQAVPIEEMHVAEDLSLIDEEIATQLAEDILASQQLPSAVPTTKQKEGVLVVSPIASPSHIRHGALIETSLQTYSSTVFQPHSAPEDIFAYFDFPEEESPEEADLVELDSLKEECEPTFEEHISFPKPAWYSTLLGHGWQRAIASFVALSFVFVLPLHAMNLAQNLRGAKTEIEQTGYEAVSLLSSGAKAALAKDTSQAQSEFNSATQHFQNAKNTIVELGLGTDALLSVVPVAGKTYRSGQYLIEAGNELAIAGERITEGYHAMESEFSSTPISRLNILETYLVSTIPHLESANEALAQVDTSVIPTEYKETLTLAKQTLPVLINTIEEFETFYQLASKLLGAEGTKRYLILFQNNTEIRPTGGFIGSFAEIKVHNGVIEHLNVPGGGTYDLQGSLKRNLIAPEPLQLLSARWEFQDANWFPDFPTSARQIIQFYQDAGGPSVDGVLAINATFVANLIGILGPIEMEDYGRTIDEENFIFEAQRIVEYEYDKEENKPKAFIGDLAPKLVDRAIEKTSEDFLSLVDYLNVGLSQKDIQLYLQDESLQKQIIEQGWGGEIKWTDGDYLMVVDTNLGGGKTDGVIKQDISLDVDIQSNGSITNTLTISRTHLGIQGLLFTGVNNVDFLRVYVPKGSSLIEAEGFSPPDKSLFETPEEHWELDDDILYGLLHQTTDPINGTVISEEHGKTVFGNWVQTRPGTTSTIRLRYTLPFSVDTINEENLLEKIQSFVGLPQTDHYTLQIQKQSGIIDRSTNVQLHVPDHLKLLWSSHGTNASLNNETDVLFATLFESL